MNEEGLNPSHPGSSQNGEAERLKLGRIIFFKFFFHGWACHFSLPSPICIARTGLKLEFPDGTFSFCLCYLSSCFPSLAFYEFHKYDTPLLFRFCSIARAYLLPFFDT